MSHNPEDVRPIVEKLCEDRELNPIPKDTLAKLSHRIWDYFLRNKETRRQLESKIKLWKDIESPLHSQENVDLKVTGSTFTGFGKIGSDVDMCVFSKSYPGQDSMQLSRIEKILRKECGHYLSGEVVRAKVPVLSMMFKDAENETINIDMTVNNNIPVRNTHLLFYYSQLDQRVRPLVMAVKWWAKKNDINEPRFMTLSSYTLTLMVINYLQCGVSPPVLPCLQEEYPQIFNTSRSIFDLEYDDKTILTFKSKNKQSVGSLFQDFFGYYTSKTRYDYEKKFN